MYFVIAIEKKKIIVKRLLILSHTQITMIMRKLWLLLALVLTFSMAAKAQVTYYGKELFNSQKLQLLQQTTTLFTLQYKNYQDLQQFDEAIKKVWTITPYKIIKPEELSKYQTAEQYSFFSFDTFNTKTDETLTSNIIYSLALVTPSDVPKKKNIYTLAYVTLSPDLYTGINAQQRSGGKEELTRTVKRNLIGDFYNSSIFFNWSPGFLAGYLKQINDGLLFGQSRSLDFQFYNKIRVPELTKETLYVPEYIRQLFSAQQPASSMSDEKLEPYNYKLKFVTSEQLDSLILAPQSNIKYLIYTRRTNDKIISIYDSKDNQIIYQMLSAGKPDVEMNDLNKIKQVIQTIASNK